MRRPGVPADLIDCLSAGRRPTVPELMRMAERVWIEGAPERSTAAWKRLSDLSEDRANAVRFALVALCGDGS